MDDAGPGTRRAGEWREHQPAGACDHNYMVKERVVRHPTAHNGHPTEIIMGGRSFRDDTSAAGRPPQRTVPTSSIQIVR